MKLTAKQYARLLDDLTITDAKKAELFALAFVQRLAARSELKLWPKIEKELLILRTTLGELTVELTTARPLTAVSKKSLASTLCRRWSVASIVWQDKIQPALIGGFVARAGSRVLDGSLAGEFQKFLN